MNEPRAWSLSQNRVIGPTLDRGETVMVVEKAPTDELIADLKKQIEELSDELELGG